MSRSLPFILASSLFTSPTAAQWDELKFAIGDPLLTAILDGYEMVDSMAWETDRNSVLVFAPDSVEGGYTYLIMVFVAGCAECSVRTGFLYKDELELIDLPNELQRSGSYAMATRLIDQPATVAGIIQAYADVDSPLHTVGLLMRKNR